jgi:gluconate 2-dehydrogenase gamma chain
LVRILQPGPERFLGASEKEQVAALFEAILPGDEHSPGAKEVDAAEYLSVLLALDDSAYYELAGWKKLYGQALPALDLTSAELHEGRGLIELSLQERAELLSSLAQGTLAGMPAEIDQPKFFATLRGHCIEGCFADPRWGGNRDGLMWRWFGYLTAAEDVEAKGKAGVGESNAG